MVSQRKMSANRRNAQRSTGPRTTEGKGQSKRNSWRHGFSIRLHLDVSPEIQRLASAIAAKDPDPARLHFATIAAEAEVELLRVRAVRRSLIMSKATGDFSALDSEQAVQALAAVLPDLYQLDRYERRAFSRRNRAFELL